MNNLKLKVGDTVYKKVEKRHQRGFLYPEHNVGEGEITKIGRKYVHVNFSGDSRFPSIEQVPFETLSNFNRYSKYFLDLKEYELLKDKIEGEQEVNQFFREGFGNNIQNLSHEDVINIRDIIRNHQKGEN